MKKDGSGSGALTRFNDDVIAASDRFARDPPHAIAKLPDRCQDFLNRRLAIEGFHQLVIS